MEMVGRVYNKGGYRYGFNGKENDNEVQGVGNSVDFGARIYDSRVGRFLSIDPFAKNNPSETHYGFAGNSPIKFVDWMGNFKIDPTLEKKYPRFAKLLKQTTYQNITNNSQALGLFTTLTGNSAEYMKTIYTNGSGPTIYLMEEKYNYDPTNQKANGGQSYEMQMGETIGEDGLYYLNSKTGDIQINENLIKLYERAESAYAEKGGEKRLCQVVALQFLIETTIIHESFHHGSMLDPSTGEMNGGRGYSGALTNNEEVGWAAEEALYGKPFTYDSYRHYMHENNIQDYDSGRMIPGNNLTPKAKEMVKNYKSDDYNDRRKNIDQGYFTE
jgi:RHS repeat-associated protein